MQNQIDSYFDLRQKHEKTSTQNKFSRLVLSFDRHNIFRIYPASVFTSVYQQQDFSLPAAGGCVKGPLAAGLESEDRVDVDITVNRFKIFAR